MAIDRWSVEELEIIIDNFDKSRIGIQDALAESGFIRTIEAVKAKKRHLRSSGEMPAYGSASSAEPEEVAEEEDPAYVDGEGFFPDAKKLEIYGKYKDMMEELTKEASVIGRVVDDSPVSSVSESIVLMLSDLHIGKSVVDEDGYSVYNIEIALERLKQIAEGIKRVISHARRSTTIDEIVVCLIGDILDGDNIYKTQAHHLDDHIAGQLKAGTKALWDLITDLAAIDGIKKVRVATVRGNHGRASDSSHEDSNMDNLLYDNLQFAATLHGDDKISVTTKYSAFHVVEVKGHRLLLRHEAPLTCDTSAARAKLGGWCDIHKCDAILSGHYHHTQISTFADRYIIRNGSTVGPDNLSERMAVTSKPEQIVFGISPKRLPTFIYPVTLT